MVTGRRSPTRRPTMAASVGFALRTALVTGLAVAVLTAGAGIAGLLAIGVVSVAMTMLRRRHGRRLLAARVATRLARITGASGATHGDGPARKGASSVD